MKTSDIVKQLRSTSSSNEKLEILKTHKDNCELKEFFRIALDTKILFYIKKIPVYFPIPDVTTLTIAMTLLNSLSSRRVTGNDGIQFLASVLSSLSEKDAELLCCIIEKNPKCNVSVTTVNKVWGKDFIKEIPIMKASPYDEKTIKNINYPALSQAKIDGARAQVVVDADNKTVTMYSSNGNIFDLHGVLDEQLILMNDQLPPAVIDGELVVIVDNQIQPRKIGNGILNKALKGTITKKEADNVHFMVFDVIPLRHWLNGAIPEDDCNFMTYKDRWYSLTAMFWGRHEQLKKIHRVTCFKVNSEKEALDHFFELYNSGNEGTILKDLSGLWENARSKKQIKFKGIQTCDLKVVGVEEGKNKYSGKLGALICHSADGLLEVRVGSGLSDVQRELLPMNSWIGKIVEIAYNEKIKNKDDNSKWSLFLPRFIEERFDKDVADPISLIKDNIK